MLCKKNKEMINEYNKQDNDMFHDRLERKCVEELVESVQLVSKQLDDILEDLDVRDSEIERLEMEVNEQKLIIEKLTEDFEFYNKKTIELEEENANLNNKLEENVKLVERQGKRLDRKEEELQRLYDENIKLKEELENSNMKKMELEEKLAMIGNMLN